MRPENEITHAESIAIICDQAETIEWLNAQVAMLRHNIAWVSGLVENWSGEENGHHDRIMSQSSDEWLAAHDAKVRDDAIKEIHNAVVRLFSAAKEKS